MTKINLNDAVQTLNLGEAGELSVNVAELCKHEAVVNYIFNYGLKQMLNDVHASITKKVEADDETRKASKRSLAEKKLASLLAGNVAQERVGTSDPVGKLMKEMATEAVTKAIRGAGKKVKDFSKESFNAAVKAMLEKNGAKYRQTAEAKLAIKADTSAGEVDIMSLLG